MENKNNININIYKSKIYERIRFWQKMEELNKLAKKKNKS